jgi:hypothetical protein
MERLAFALYAKKRHQGIDLYHRAIDSPTDFWCDRNWRMTRDFIATDRRSLTVLQKMRRPRWLIYPLLPTGYLQYRTSPYRSSQHEPTR